MNKYTVPIILAATILVAGIFVLIPIEKASTVHTTITTEINANEAKLDIIDTNVDDIETAVGAKFAIDVVNQVVGDDSSTASFDFDLTITGLVAGDHFIASFIIQLTDAPDATGTVAPTVLIQVFDGDELLDAQVTEPTPADDGADHVAFIDVTGEVETGDVVITFTVDEGSDATGATLDIQGVVEKI